MHEFCESIHVPMSIVTARDKYGYHLEISSNSEICLAKDRAELFKENPW